MIKLFFLFPKKVMKASAKNRRKQKILGRIRKVEKNEQILLRT